MGARKMVKLKVEETSGVDHPAHLEEGWIVMKAANKGANVNKLSKKATEMEDDDEAVKAKKMPKFIQDKIDAREDDEDMDKADEDEDEDMEMDLDKADDEDMDKADEDEDDFEAMFAKMKADRDMYKGKYEEMEKKYGSSDDEDEAMEKAAPAPVRAMLKKARDEAAAARSALRKEVDARRDRDYVAKAAAWSALSIKPEELGRTLRKTADVNPSLAETIMTALASANAQAEAANIFAELGSTARPDSGDAYGRMTKMAKAAVEAGDHKTVEQAISSLIVTHPELYEAYRAENR
jgi:hypothetical protein